MRHDRILLPASVAVRFATAILVVFAAASSQAKSPGVSSPASPPEIKTVTTGEVTAHFGGERPSDAPLRFGVQALWFSFRGDDAVYPFKPDGGVSFWGWNLDIFSPDGKRVLLLQNRYGPYHVVRTSRLKDYLRGRAKADEIVGQIPKPGETAAIHEEARWLSATRLRYVVACCGGRIVKTHRLHLAAGSIRVPDPLMTFRPGLWNGLWSPSFGIDQPTDLVRAYYEYSRRAKQNPGRWEKGRIEQGANPREYVPSDEELILAELGGQLLEAVENKGWGRMADELGAAGISLDEIRFTEFTFRYVDVMGTGRFHYVAASRKVCARRSGPPLICE